MREDIVFRLIRGGRYGEPICGGEPQIEQSQDVLKPVSVQLMRYASRLAEALDGEGHSCKVLDNRKNVLMEVSWNGDPEVTLLMKLRESLAAFRRFGQRHYLCTAVEDLEGKPIDVHRPPTNGAISHIRHQLSELCWEQMISSDDYGRTWPPNQMRIETSRDIPMFYSEGRIEAYRERIRSLKAELHRLAWQPASPLKSSRAELAVLCNGIGLKQEDPGTSAVRGPRRENPPGNIDLLKYAIKLACLFEQSLGFECGLQFSRVRNRLYLHIIDQSRELKIAYGAEPFDHLLVLLDAEKEREAGFHSEHRFLVLGSFEDPAGCPLDLEQEPDDDILRYVGSRMAVAHETRQEIFLP